MLSQFLVLLLNMLLKLLVFVSLYFSSNFFSTNQTCATRVSSMFLKEQTHFDEINFHPEYGTSKYTLICFHWDNSICGMKTFVIYQQNFFFSNDCALYCQSLHDVVYFCVLMIVHSVNSPNL